MKSIELSGIKRSDDSSNKKFESPVTFYQFVRMNETDHRDSLYERKEFMLFNNKFSEEDLQMLRKTIENLKNANTALVNQNNNLNAELLSAKAKQGDLEKKNDFMDEKINRYLPHAFDLNGKNSYESRRLMYEKKLTSIVSKIGDVFKDNDDSVIRRIIRKNVRHSGINKDEVDFLIDLKSRQDMIEHSKVITVLEASQTIPNQF